MVNKTAEGIVDRVAEETGDTAAIFANPGLLGSDQAAVEYAGVDVYRHLTIADSDRTH